MRKKDMQQIKFILLIALLPAIAGPINAQEMNKTKEIIKTVGQIFNSTDAREWDKVAQSFAQEVLLDYTSLAGGQPVKLTPEQIVGSWKTVLPGFDKTRHMIGHFEVKMEDKQAKVTHFGTANHYLNGQTWTVIGNYEEELTLIDDTWRVSAMKFNLEFIDGNTDLPRLAKERLEGNDNRSIVNRFFLALENQEFDDLKIIFAENGRQLNPYIPAGFPTRFDGSEAIFKQYNGLTENFGKMEFPRSIYATEDPDFFFVKFQGKIEIKAGGTYENDYLATFRLKDGKIIEYTEYFNPIVMAKAFGLKLD